METIYTYLHCKPDGTPFYVGKGAWKRAHSFNNRNMHYNNIVAKYGRDAIMMFAFPCDSNQQAKQDEIQHIAQLRAEGYALANYTDGGEGNYGGKISEEKRKKLSDAAKRRPCLVAGHFKSPEERAKLSAALKGRVFSPDWRHKMSIAAKARAQRGVSLETRKKLSDGAKRQWARVRARG